MTQLSVVEVVALRRQRGVQPCNQWTRPPYFVRWTWTGSSQRDNRYLQESGMRPYCLHPVPAVAERVVFRHRVEP